MENRNFSISKEKFKSVIDKQFSISLEYSNINKKFFRGAKSLIETYIVAPKN